MLDPFLFPLLQHGLVGVLLLGAGVAGTLRDVRTRITLPADPGGAQALGVARQRRTWLCAVPWHHLRVAR